MSYTTVRTCGVRRVSVILDTFIANDTLASAVCHKNPSFDMEFYTQ